MFCLIRVCLFAIDVSLPLDRELPFRVPHSQLCAMLTEAAPNVHAVQPQIGDQGGRENSRILSLFWVSLRDFVSLHS